MMQRYPHELVWKGPYPWVNSMGDLAFDCPDADRKGLYLWTIKYGDGYLIYYVGETGKSFRERISEHRTTYRSGAWRIFEPQKFGMSQKELLCPGYGNRKDYRPTPQEGLLLKAEFRARRRELTSTLTEMMLNYRIFVAPFDGDERMRRWIECAILKALEARSGIVSQFLDDSIERRRCRPAQELPITVRMTAPVVLLGLPDALEV